ncbi:hypothetical protein CQW23_16577 [Capsicum baccatum]|uniref:Uncharacterized protein n=1 Tax=Capsicum baccatum TaxID=33114 RepID=A0A2G2WBH8_CAPBA|nr:hypothetical protein CQW23_16577 [Capsicum baccatum]
MRNVLEHKNNMIDFEALYTFGESLLTINEIVDAVLDTKLGYIKGIGYGPKPNTTRETQKRTTKLEDSLEKAKQEDTSAQNELQKLLNAAETVVENQQSWIQD